MKTGFEDWVGYLDAGRADGMESAKQLLNDRRTVRTVVLAAWLGGILGFWWTFSWVPAPLQPGTSLSVTSGSNARLLSESVSAKRSEDRNGLLPAVDSLRLSSTVSGNLHRLLALRDEGASADELLQLAEAIYRDLLLAGSAATADVLDFLLSGDDVFLKGQAGAPFGFGFQSLRLALIDALKQIGGREVEEVLLGQLRATESNAELEALAGVLEWMQPGLYRASILDAVLARLAQLSSALEADAPVDAAPLFRILQDFGDTSTTALLQGVPYWLHAYAQVAMANLPGGLGIDELARATRRDLRRGGESRNLHLLVQAAAQNSRAERILLDLVLEGEIPDETWPLLGDILIGDRHLQLEEPTVALALIGSLRSSNPFAIHTIADRHVQLIYSVNYSAVLSADEAAMRLSLIDSLMEVALSSAANSTLWRARELLETHY